MLVLARLCPRLHVLLLQCSSYSLVLVNLICGVRVTEKMHPLYLTRLDGSSQTFHAVSSPYCVLIFLQHIVCTPLSHPANYLPYHHTPTTLHPNHPMHSIPTTKEPQTRPNCATNAQLSTPLSCTFMQVMHAYIGNPRDHSPSRNLDATTIDCATPRM